MTYDHRVAASHNMTRAEKLQYNRKLCLTWADDCAPDEAHTAKRFRELAGAYYEADPDLARLFSRKDRSRGYIEAAELLADLSDKLYELD